MNFGEFIQYYERKVSVKKITQKYDLETSSTSFFIFK